MDKQKKKEYDKELYKKNREKILKRQKEYRQNNKEKLTKKRNEYRKRPEVRERINKKNREYYKKHREEKRKYDEEYNQKNKTVKRKRYKGYYQKNKEIINKKHREYQKDNIEEFREYQKKYKKNRRRTNKNLNIICRLRNLFRYALETYSKTGKCKKSKDYGIDWQVIIEYLKPFPEDISLYHVDHIKPLCSFNLEDPKEIKIAFAPENHQWLLASENRSKGGKYDKEN